MSITTINFLQFLQEIQYTAPKSIYTLDPLSSVNHTIALTDHQIQQLIDFAVSYKPYIQWGDTQKIPMLTFMMSMGTQEKPHTPDKILFEKDPRIEDYIIKKALARAKANASATHIEKVVFGLSGNPPTMDHLCLIQHLASKYRGVYLVLNAQSPIKNKKNYVSAEIRLKMLTSMLEAENIDPSSYEVSLVEVQRDPPSRMIATLSLLMLYEPEPVQFTLVLGIDALLHFDRWYQWEHLGGLCRVKFYPRPGIALDEERVLALLRKMKSCGIQITLVYNNLELKKQYEKISSQFEIPLSIEEENMTTTIGSSTQLRDYYASSQSAYHLPFNVHPVVDREIRKQQLYGYKLCT